MGALLRVQGKRPTRPRPLRLQRLSFSDRQQLVDTPAVARASALIYSLVETATAYGLEPYLWLRNVLRELRTATTVEHFDTLMPWNQKQVIVSSA